MSIKHVHSLTPATPPTSAGAETPLWETWAVRLIIVGFVAVAMIAIVNSATYGQDFDKHQRNTEEFISRRGTWFVQSQTNRPALAMIGSLFVRLAPNNHPYRMASLAFVVFAAIALKLIHVSCKRLIKSPLLRVSAVLFIAYLPLTLITSVVFAEDALTLLPFVLAGTFLVQAFELEPGLRAFKYYGAVGASLIAGELVKATFELLPMGVLLCAVVLTLSGRKVRSMRWFAVLCVFAPLVCGVAIQYECHRELAGLPPAHHFELTRDGKFTASHLVFPKSEDVAIFRAPSYWEKERVGDKEELVLLETDRFSYPALLDLAIFSDVMNISSRDHRSNWNAADPRAKKVARIEIGIGVIFMAATLAAVMFVLGRLARGLLTRGRMMPSVSEIVWGVLSMTWYIPLTLSLLFIKQAYDMGYWLPRLVFPAICIFFMFCFFLVDRVSDVPGKWARVVRIGVFGLTVAQSACGALQIILNSFP